MSPIFQVVGVHKNDARIAPNRCSTCRLREQCLPMGLDAHAMQQLEGIVTHRYRVPQGDYLYRMNAPFSNLYAVQLGSFKSVQGDSNGTEHLVGFHMSGELLGMDAINTGRHHSNSVALQDSEVCAIPFKQLEVLFAEIPLLLHNFQRLMSKEITVNQSRMVLLGNMRAEQRMATFLINLSARYQTRGYSATRFHLPMTRKDIGNYLGMTIESVSRLMTGFRKKDVLNIDNRELDIIDLAALQKIALGTVDLKMPSILTMRPRTSFSLSGRAV